jgi:hypothetical protein
MLTTDFYLVQRLVMRAARTFPVITSPQEGFRLDVRLVSVTTRLSKVQLQRSYRESTLTAAVTQATESPATCLLATENT